MGIKPTRGWLKGALVPAASEHEEQRSLCQWLDLRGYLYCAIPNAGRRSPRLASRLKAEGMRRGAPDLVLFECGRLQDRRPVVIEMKARGGGLSAAQDKFHTAARLRGWNVIVAYGAADAIEQLAGLGL